MTKISISPFGFDLSGINPNLLFYAVCILVGLILILRITHAVLRWWELSTNRLKVKLENERRVDEIALQQGHVQLERGGNLIQTTREDKAKRI